MLSLLRDFWYAFRALAQLAAAVLAGAVPALKASRLGPVQVLGY